MLTVLALMLAQEPSALSLRCVGRVVVSAPGAVTDATASDTRGNAAYATSVTSVPVEADLVTGFEMKDGVASVFLPAEMRPSFSSSKDGWFPVQNLQMSETKITGSVKLSFMRSTVIEIDRNTGIMTTKHGYRADCEPIDRSVRKF